jgi:hypothetical protein
MDLADMWRVGAFESWTINVCGYAAIAAQFV